LPSSSSLASDDGEEDGRRPHHPGGGGVGRGALDRGKEATVCVISLGCQTESFFK
jgi:hypothetical protein